MTLARRRLLRTLSLGGASAGLLAACTRIGGVADVGDRFAGSAPLSVRGDQVRRAAASLGWKVEDVRPGVARAVLDVRSHQAVVEIPYDSERFLIRYSDSRNLAYDGTTIHRNYVGWVERLSRTIVAESART